MLSRTSMSKPRFFCTPRVVAIFAVLAAVPLQASAANPKACSKRTKQLEKHLGEIPKHVGLGLSPIRMVPAIAPEPEMIVQRGILIDINSQEIALEGQRISDGHQAIDTVLERIPEIEKLLGTENPPVYFRVDHRTPIDVALSAMCKVAAKRDVRLVVRPTTAPERKYAPPAPPEGVRRLLTALASERNPVKRAQVISKAFDESIGKCESVRAGVALANMVPPAERSMLMQRAVVDGLNTCKCEGADIDSLESLLILMMAPISPPAFSITPPTLPCGQEKPYGLKPTLNFDALVEKLNKRAD